MKMIIRIVATALAATLLLGLAACASTPGGAPTCPTPPAATATGTTVAVLASTGRSQPGSTADIQSIVNGAAKLHARTLVSGVAGASAPSLLADVDLVGRGDNSLARTTDITCKERAVTGAVAQLRHLGAPKKLDVFDALMTLSGNLEASHRTGTVDVVLDTPTTSTASPVDLSDRNTLSDPVAALNALATSGKIPNCSGWRIFVVGGSDDAALREFWREYALRCGGKVVAWTSHLTAFPGPEAAIGRADTGITVEHHGSTVTSSLSGDVLFPAGSAILLPGAQDPLLTLLAEVTATSGPIRIVGFTDVGSTAAANLRLSKARAAAVGAWLTSHGVPSNRLTVSGVGSKDALYPHPMTNAQHAANRRVVVAAD
jgi:outer membrane protein OmpA-like peptidoglycan-associated protein